MDTTFARERNYRIVEELRQKNLREQRRLSNDFHSKGGMNAVHRTQIAEVSKEQRRIKRELVRIRQSTSTSLGALPPRIDTLGRDHHSGSDYYSWRSERKGSSDTESENSQKKNSYNFTHPRYLDPEGEGHSDQRKSMYNVANGPTHAYVDKKKNTNTRGYPESDEMEPSEEERKKVRRVRKRSQKQIRKESKKTEEFLKKFDERFPVDSDFSSSLSDIGRSTINGTASDVVNQVEQTGSKSAIFVDVSPVHGDNAHRRNGKVDNDTTLSTRNIKLDVPIAGINVNEARNNALRRLGNGSDTEMEVVSQSSSPRMIRTLSPINEKFRTAESIGNISESGNKSTQDYNDDLVQAATNTTNTENPPSPNRQKKKKKSKGDEEEERNSFDRLRYNPDGSLRTVHMMPDFQESITQAMKARYVRHKCKQWYERELSVKEILAKDGNGQYKQ